MADLILGKLTKCRHMRIHANQNEHQDWAEGMNATRFYESSTIPSLGTVIMTADFAFNTILDGVPLKS